MVAAGLAAAYCQPKFKSLRTLPEVKELFSSHKMFVNSINFFGKWKKHVILNTLYIPSHNSKEFAMYYLIIVCHVIVIIPFLVVDKLRHREIKQLIQSHTENQ